MKIKTTYNSLLTFKTEKGLRNAANSMHEKRLCIVLLESECGQHFGLGECWIEKGFIEALPAHIEDIARTAIDGATINDALNQIEKSIAADPEGGDRIRMSALSAFNIALWDLKGKTEHTPLYQLLGGEQQAIPIYASGGLYTANDSPARLIDEIQSYIDLGFNAVKIKVGGLEIEEDIERIRAVKNHFGDTLRLMLDANSALNFDHSAKLLDKLSPFNLEWLEEPIARNQFEQLTLLNQNSAIDLCGYEDEAGLDNLKRLVNERCVNQLQVDITICGGISQGKSLAEFAGEKSVPFTLHTASSAILYFANLHLASATKVPALVENHRLHQWLFNYVAAEDKHINNSFAKAPNKPGIGFSISPDEISARIV